MLHANRDVPLGTTLARYVLVSSALLFVLLCIPVDADSDTAFGGVSNCISEDVVGEGIHCNVEVPMSVCTRDRVFVHVLDVGIGTIGKRAGWCGDCRRNGFAHLRYVHRGERRG